MKKDENNPSQCPICEKPTYKETKYCIFHASAEEKTENEFKKALKEYVDKIKEEDGDYNFKKFVFIGDIDFKRDLNITILKNANFRKVIFDGKTCFQGVTFKKNFFSKNISFKGATFEKDASFRETIFEDVVYFNGATFKRNTFFDGAAFKEICFSAFFNEAIFEGYTSFNKTIFEGDAYFRDATFKGNMFFTGTYLLRDHYFNDITFKRNTFFDGATFKGEAYFQGTIFKKDTFFDRATFEKDASFKLKYFNKILSLHETKIFPGKKCSIKINNGKGKIFFNRAYLENTYLDIVLAEDSMIDFSGALLKNTTIKKGQIEKHILPEDNKEFSKAQEIYLLLKNNFHSIGQYEDESWAFTKEKDMEKFSNSFDAFLNRRKKKSQFNKILLNIKKSLVKRIIVKFWLRKKWLFSKKAIKWFNLSFSNFIYQYGENPWYVIRFAFIVILIFAALLTISGIVNGDRTELILKQIEEMQGSNVLKYSGPVIGNFMNCLYFSVVTFTTLGYGDFQPLEGWSRFLVSSEALLGAFTMALL